MLPTNQKSTQRTPTNPPTWKTKWTCNPTLNPKTHLNKCQSRKSNTSVKIKTSLRVSETFLFNYLVHTILITLSLTLHSLPIVVVLISPSNTIRSGGSDLSLSCWIGCWGAHHPKAVRVMKRLGFANFEQAFVFGSRSARLSPSQVNDRFSLSPHIFMRFFLVFLTSLFSCFSLVEET